MAQRKPIIKPLLDASKAALFAGIEIHNKPHIAFRYPTASILIIDAWELALKAYVYKYIGRKKIYEKDGRHTISFSKALALVRDHIKKKKRIKSSNRYMKISTCYTITETQMFTIMKAN